MKTLHNHRAGRILSCIGLVAFLLCGVFQVCAVDWFGREDPSETQHTETKEDSYAVKTSNGHLDLLLSSAKGSVQVMDHATDYLWNTCCAEDISDDDANGYTNIRKNIASALMCTYFSKDAGDATYITIYSSECDSVSSTDVNGGVDVTYHFDSISINITVEYRLENNVLLVSIPHEKIEETADYLLSSISLSPYFGCGRDTDNGFVVIPDGCGSVINFKKDHPRYTSVFDQSVYGSDTIQVESDIYSSQQSVLLPVFGISHGESAMTCDIRQGAEEANIVCWPSGYRMNVVNVYPCFNLRRSFYATLDNASTVRKFSTKALSQDYSVAYTFLPTGKSSYSDMAQSYRSYLLQTGKLQKKTNKTDTMALNIFMAAEKKKILANDYIPVTTFSQAESMLQELNDAGTKNVLVNLSGWAKGGKDAWPQRFPIPSGIGGSSGSKKINEYARSAQFDLFYEDNYLSADKERGSVSLKNVVYQENGIIAETNDKKTKYLFSPLYAFKTYQKSLESYQKMGADGIAFENIGQMLYYDYNPNYEDITRTGTEQVWKNMLTAWKTAGGNVAVQGGNLYALSAADWAYDIPERDSGYFFRDQTVPFYQMVVHGSVLYTGTPVNVFSDAIEDYLKMIEYGYTPLFLLSNDNPDQLSSSYYNRLFSSKFEDYKERIIQEYQLFSNEFEGLNQQAMVGHAKVDEGVYCTTYSGGTKVYVNYSSSVYAGEDVCVEPESFTVQNAEG